MDEKDLSKMGAARVTLDEYDGVRCIQKQNASPVELGFYQSSAAYLTGVNTPRLLGVQGSNIFIEYIPHAPSMGELINSDSVFEQLAYIHRSKHTPAFDIHCHSWTSESTEHALKTLDFPEGIKGYFRNIQAISGELFSCPTLISGDSNQGNWGRRDNGELVLFDWERFGCGSPAIDLAPLVNQMGTMADYEAIVSQYTRHSSALPDDVLVKHLVLAKSWLVIEVTNLLVLRGKAEADMYINWFRQKIPPWVESIEKAL